MIGIHRGLSRLAVFPTHFLIMLVDFFFIPTEVDHIYSVHAHDAMKERLLGWFQEGMKIKRGPLHKKNDISLHTLGQEGRG